MEFENGANVKVLDQSGNICAAGKYYGKGMVKKELNAKIPNVPHYAILIEGKGLQYYPTGYYTIMPG